MTRLLKTIIPTVLSLTLAGCASVTPLSVVRMPDAEAIAPDNRNIVLINHTAYDLEIRQVLMQNGFNVKKFASINETQLTIGSVSKTFNEAQARYGITQYQGQIIDRCLGGTSVKFRDYTLEVADLKTNDVVMTIQKGGWTKGC